MAEPVDQAAVRAALSEIRADEGRSGWLQMSRTLAAAGYSTAVIDKAGRIARDERLSEASDREDRRQERVPRIRRLRVVGALVVALVLGYVATFVASSSAGLGPNGQIVLLALFGFVLLPAFAAGLIAAAGASKRVARAGLIGLNVALPIALLLGWAAGGGTVTNERDTWRQLLDPAAMEPLLVVMAMVLVASIPGYAVGTLASRSRQGI